MTPIKQTNKDGEKIQLTRLKSLLARESNKDLRKIIAIDYIKKSYYSESEEDYIKTIIETIPKEPEPLEFVEDIFFHCPIQLLPSFNILGETLGVKDKTDLFLAKLILKYYYKIQHYDATRIKEEIEKHKLPNNILEKLKNLLETDSNKKTGYSLADKAINNIIEQWSCMNNLNDQEKKSFLNVLSSIANFTAQNLHEPLHKQKKTIFEEEFQKCLQLHLRQEFGENILRGDWSGAGPMDLRACKIPIELKVEKKIAERKAIIKKYISQPTQYCSASSQLGILCIFDLTQKDLPPSNIANEITLESPNVHGFSETNPEFPTVIGVVFIQGNLKLPSDYSK